MKIINIIFILTLFSFVFSPSKTQAYSPLSVPNNKFGVHILDPQEVVDAAKLVNSTGGDWGYVTIPIRSDDRDRAKWFTFFTECRRLHLIPIIRLATYVDGDKWVAPTSFDLVDFANFLTPMPWPTENRYVILFNEINHSKEWGGRVSPLEYATLLLDAKRIFKERSDNYFLLTAGLDMSAPSNNTSMDALNFYRQMTLLQPDWYSAIDGLSVHAYPNPGFSASVYSKSRFGITSFIYEEELLKKFSFSGKPIFITETGYIGREDFYTPAYTEIWTQNNIAAITPFILFAGAGDFTKFSLLDITRNPGISYRTIEKITKISGAPLLNTQLPPLSEPIIQITPTNSIHRSENNTEEKSPKQNLWQRIKKFIFPNNLHNAQIRNYDFLVEIAANNSTRATGLSYRNSLPENQGMLFKFGRPVQVNFWMNEMRFPLDLIWIKNGYVIGLTENVPPPEKTNNIPVQIIPPGEYDQAIEVNAGFIQKNKIMVGDKFKLD